MKNKSLATWLGTGAIALSLAVLPSTLPASAQTTTDPVVPDNTGTTTTTDDDDGFDWGWLGLLGLGGLAGLKGRDHDNNRATYADRTTRT
jgi:MYXO-CTERM domain-containing protein